MGHEHRSVLGAQVAKCPVDRVPRLECPGRVRRAVLDRRQELSQRHLPPLAPGRPVDAADEHPVEPGPEAVRVAERAQVAPRRDQGLLDGVRGKVGVREHELREVVELADRRGRQDAEGVPVASLCPLHQIPLHARNCLRPAAPHDRGREYRFRSIFWAGRWRRRPVERIDPTSSL